MTFCIGLNCVEGLIAIADTRITSGTEASTAKKITVHQFDRFALFVLTSGLRSVRDKAITYFEERLREDAEHLDRMFKAANTLAEELRRVRSEDQRWLAESGLLFDIHCIVGGQLRGDDRHHLFLIYPEGNWIEVSVGTPYVIIGESAYGKPVLDRAWRYDQSLADALRDGLLAFDATRTSATDVDPPCDVVLYRTGSFAMHETRLSVEDLDPLARYWNRAIGEAVRAAESVVQPLFDRLEAGGVALEPPGSPSGG